MSLKLRPIKYSNLNSRQKENFNFLKVSAILADYGFITMRLTDDWQGADFIAQHIDGKTFLKVQLKGRMTFDKKYWKKDIYVTFFNASQSAWYLYPHDELLAEVLPDIEHTESWNRGTYTFSRLSKKLIETLKPYKVEHRTTDGIPLEDA